MRKSLKYVLLGALSASLFLTACSSTSNSKDEMADLSGTVMAAGSSALKPLADEAAKEFSEKYPDVAITIDAGGSGVGLKQVADGTVDIGNSDVAAEEKLDKELADKLVDHQVAIMSIATIAHPGVGVKDLTQQQLTDIFTGKVTNWKEVGGKDLPIVLIGRPSSSGTRAVFEKLVMNGESEKEDATMETDDSGTLLQNVESTEGAIGYVALPYLVSKPKVQTIAIDGVEPTLENTYNGTYKVWSVEHMYTQKKPSKAVKAFLAYFDSKDFAKTCEKLGYGVTSKMKDGLL